MTQAAPIAADHFAEMEGMILAGMEQPQARPVYCADRWANRVGPTVSHGSFVERLAHYRNNRDLLNRIFSQMADAASVRRIQEMFVMRVLGAPRFQTTGAERWAEFLAIADSRRIGDSAIHLKGFPSGRFADDFLGQALTMDIWRLNFVSTFLEKQYYFSRGEVSIQPAPGDTALDLGACFGDTALAFACSVGNAGRVISVEPSPANRQVLNHNLALNAGVSGRISIETNPISHASDLDVVFSEADAGSNVNAGGQLALKSISIDDIVVKHGLAKVDFIKMDIEGMELSALRGGLKTLRQHRPKLAVCAYHGLQIFKLMDFLGRELPTYRIFAELHSIHHEELVLYAADAGKA